MSEDPLKIGLALSGGGSRAIAFHLGCLRALQDRGLLERVSVVSSVSGGSVIAALWAYSDDSFEDFEDRVIAILRRGLVKGIVRETLFSKETLLILGTLVTSGVTMLVANLLLVLSFLLSKVGWRDNPFGTIATWLARTFRRYASRSTAFERHLRGSHFGDMRMNEVSRSGLNVVINASELRTATAFRYGSKETGCWRLGTTVGASPRVSQAVASSAAFPVLLPAFDQVLEFEKSGRTAKKRVLLSDGGVYENLGISCLVPGRSPKYSTNVFECNFIISCDAGHGQPAGDDLVYNWGGRMNAAVNSIFRRATNQGYSLLHDLAESEQITGFVLPYLGLQDKGLPHRPSDLISRDQVKDYPTDFFSMSEEDIALLSGRGEQLTRLLIEHYHPAL
ncbi:patatin [Roseobacter sp. HKCCD9010]|uniref:patatin-like phospholipase family protein n=1 Tax=unclassified Roseobacter TaxID=196798 RepID=UPI001492F213|nr:MULTISPECIES: patatin-like phospholipase family protein [unclassified Roseobacter]MBF9052099.1 patatin [Rhodobacterales bacterium HKCCD4356]NNV14021.1 patatin [Roseobacter sp. HKCCD7357]NNV18262.1 patatin [Roseobacter sp. HKCCD8768]NNV27720.1 patatin [Roseobacter sp. HKCCD8192]NNV31963.1 patatin [Roseobacter sp. HKCCD9061]